MIVFFIIICYFVFFKEKVCVCYELWYDINNFVIINMLDFVVEKGEVVSNKYVFGN